MDPAEATVEGAGHGLSQRGLAYARHILDEEMPLTEDRHHDQGHHIAFADNDPLDILLEPGRHSADVLDPFRPCAHSVNTVHILMRQDKLLRSGATP